MFSVHTIGTIIQLEKVMKREFLIPKKHLTAPYILKVLSNPHATSVLLVSSSLSG